MSRKQAMGALFLLISLTLVLGQNCGGVRLAGMGKAVTPQLVASSSRVYSKLPVPERVDRSTRLFFLIDQSWSMANAPCPGDLDYRTPDDQPRPQDNPADCTPDPGSDFDGIRYKFTENILKKLTLTSSPDLKIAFVPFSGTSANKRPNSYLDKPELYPINSDGTDNIATFSGGAIGALKRLKEEHEATKGVPPTTDIANPPRYMKTTSLHDGMLTVSAQIDADMIKQKQAGKLLDTRYGVFIFSDGVMRPKFEHLRWAMPFMGGGICTDNSVCANEDNCRTMDPETNPHDPIYQMCPGYWAQVKQIWGDSRENKSEKVAVDLIRISSIARQQGAFPPLISLYRVNPSQLNTRLSSESLEFFDKITVPARLTYKNLQSATEGVPDLNVLIGTKVSKSYQLTQLYVRNLNARSNSMGELLTDSDGDGLVDAIDPHASEARQPGKCLDSFYFGSTATGCVTDPGVCDVTLDKDADGLNDCEEKTLNSDVIMADSDGDQIPDFLDYVFGKNVLTDDASADSSGDGHSNIENFQLGLSPESDLNYTPEVSKTKYEVYRGDLVTQQNSSGDQVSMPTFYVGVNQLPLVPTAEARGIEGLKREQAQKYIPADEVLGPTQHGANVNQILIYGQLQSIDDPSGRLWIVQKVEATYGVTKSLEIDPAKFKILYNTR